MAELCREFGISRKTGCKIFERYQECGVQGSTDRSRRPYRYANRLPFQVENHTKENFLSLSIFDGPERPNSVEATLCATCASYIWTRRRWSRLPKIRRRSARLKRRSQPMTKGLTTKVSWSWLARSSAYARP